MLVIGELMPALMKLFVFFLLVLLYKQNSEPKTKLRWPDFFLFRQKPVKFRKESSGVAGTTSKLRKDL